LGSTLDLVSGGLAFMNNSKAWIKDKQQPFPVLRLTVLGLAESGKTSLINSWVNNTCPSAYLPTENATLFYRNVRIENPVDRVDDKDKLVNVLVEIEDTYCWTLSEGLDDYGQTYGAQKFLDVSGGTRSMVQMVPGSAPMGPFAPSVAPSRTQYKPVTKARMGFLIVFDANSKESLKVAMEIHGELSRVHLNGHVIYLVANKIDIDPFNTTFRQNIAAARAYARQKTQQRTAVRFAEVSALEFTRVRKLFRDVVEEIALQPHLWSDDGEGFRAVKTDATAPDTTQEECAVQ